MPPVLNKILKLIFITASLWIGTTTALPTDQQQPATINADSAIYNRNTGIGVYIGHVKVIQGTTQILADKIISYGDKNNQISKAYAYGNPAHYQTIPQPNQTLVIATADKIEYYPVAKMVKLIGNANVIQGTNSIVSPQINYDMQTGTATSLSNPKQRTNIIYQPETQPTPPK